jgi:preprotein translocase subunit YajC
MNFLYSASLILCMTVSVFAQKGPASGSSGFAGSFIPMMVVMFVVIYFFMIRPEQKKQKAKQAMVNNLKKGDKVLTVGGIYGTVASVKNDTVMVKIGDNISVKFATSAVSTVISNKGETKTKEETKTSNGGKKK